MMETMVEEAATTIECDHDSAFMQHFRRFIPSCDTMESSTI